MCVRHKRDEMVDWWGERESCQLLSFSTGLRFFIFLYAAGQAGVVGEKSRRAIK